MYYKIFGREPAAWVGLLEAGVALAIAFGLALTGDQVGLVMAFVTAGLGAFVALRTRHASLAVIVGLAKATLALALGFGAPLSAEQTAATIALVTIAFGFFNRASTSPKEIV